MMRVLWLAPLLVVFGACSGKGNTGRKEIDPALRADVPWVNGAPPLICGGTEPMPTQYTSTNPAVPGGPVLSAPDPAVAPVCAGMSAKKAWVPQTPVYPPIGQNQPDPGSRVRFDTEEHRKQACAPLKGITRSQWKLDFEPTDPGHPEYVGIAPFFSAYDDHTDGSWHVPGDAAWYEGNGGKRDATIWGLASDPVANTPGMGAPQCPSDADPNVLDPPSLYTMHIRGGRFNWFGGGAEHVLELDCSLGKQNAEICSHVVDAVGDGRVDKAVDVSQFDGIAFWARRGPDSITGLQVVLQDKYTSDRLARTSPSLTPGVGYCKRYLVCFGTHTDSNGVERCDNGAACIPVTQGDSPTPIHRCVPDGADPSATFEPSLLQRLYPPCGVDECKPPTYDTDVDFADTTCKPYNFTGLEEKKYCFGDTPPPAADERCGDGYASNVSLSTDWTYYKLPFSGFEQVGFGKKVVATGKHPEQFEPARTLYTISFLFSVGYTDFFIDNVTFYNDK